MTDTLVPVTAGDELRTALIRAVGFDKLSEPQRELALAIASRYDLDPMLKHLVMIEGKPYITRDGLLHVAHKSGVFDGIEVSDPVLDAEPDPKGKRFWRCRATVYRKDMSRPFVYPGRYPLSGGNERYAEEMSIKVAEVMCLRRAFDVAAPTVEERWEGDDELPEQPQQPSSLIERIEQRAAAIQGSPDAEEPPTSAAPPAVVITVNDDGTADVREPVTTLAEVIEAEQPIIEEGRFVAPAGGFMTTTSIPADTTVSAQVEVSPTRAETTDHLAAFSEWASKQDMTLVKATAKGLFPDVTRFRDLEPAQLDAIVNEVTRVRALEEQQPSEEPEEDEDELLALVDDPASGSPDAEELTPADAAAEPEAAPAQAEETAPAPFSKPELCGQASPLSGATCTMDAGHKSVHRAGLKEAW